MRVRTFLYRAVLVGTVAVGSIAMTAGTAHAVANDSCANLQRLAQMHAAFGNVFYGLGNGYYAEGDYTDAASAYDRAATYYSVATSEFALVNAGSC